MTPDPAAPSMARRSRWFGLVGIDLAASGALALVSLLTGLAINGSHHPPLPLWYQSRAERLHAAVAGLVPAAPAKPGSPSGTAEAGRARSAWMSSRRSRSRHKGVVIDARTPFFYREGHVPGAVNLSREGFQADYQRLGSRLGARQTDAIAVYCSGADCHDADLVADALASLGYRKLLVYREGWEEWSQSGLPQEK